MPVSPSSKLEMSSTNTSRRFFSRFHYHFSWLLNKKLAFLTMIQLNISGCNIQTLMTRTWKNNFASLCKSYAHLRKERKDRIRLQSILISIWRQSSATSMPCKAKINKLKHSWWHLEIFIKKLNGTDKTCIYKFSKLCGISLLKTWHLKVFFCKLEHVSFMLSTACMHSKNKLT